ncbi:MAG: sulfatase-like hydrolase/transferase, partial [Phycisphaeraceae bacterium]|nr:sulfatase-like hydrolase/transferase [Phycisphaeraceae bacterium]
MSDRPNVLFIFSDQQRFDTVGAYADGRYPSIFPGLTPNLDAMAAEGTLFKHAFSCQPVCGPMRACLQTGQYASENGCTTNGLRLPTDRPLLADTFHHAGYETAYLGKWHLAHDKREQPNRRIDTPVPPEHRGGYRDYWMASDVLEFTSHGYEGYFFDQDENRVDWEGYRVDAQTNFLIDYLRDYATRADSDDGPDRPFFCMSSYLEPHHQNDLNRYVGPIGSKQRFADYHTPGDLAGTKPEPGRRADWPQHMADYLGCCWALDRAVGRIRDELETLGLAENTVIIYTSDHGCHFCTRNGEYKRSCHEASIRVPLIATGPGFTGGHAVEEMVSLIDLPPTLLAAAGAQVPDTFQGRPV